MQTMAIRTVTNSLPENEVILLTLLISKRYIPYTDLRKNTYKEEVYKEKTNPQRYKIIRHGFVSLFSKYISQVSIQLGMLSAALPQYQSASYVSYPSSVSQEVYAYGSRHHHNTWQLRPYVQP